MRAAWPAERLAGVRRTVFVPGDRGVDAYRLLTALVVPRPIAWISTVSVDGIANLAPFSFFNVASGTPPMVLFVSVGRTDTLDNVRATGEFVVNIANESLAEQVNASSAHLAPEVDEAAELGLATEPSLRVAPRRVAASPASIECRLFDATEVGDSTVVIGEVVAMTVADAVLDGQHPRFETMAPVARLGDDEWGAPSRVVRRDRPD